MPMTEPIAQDGILRADDIHARTTRRARASGSIARRRFRGRDFVIIFGLTLFLLWTILPILYLAAMSVKPEQIIMDPPSLAFRPTLDRYWELLRWHELGAPVRNSLITATLGTLGALLLGTMMALAFTLLDFPAKGPLFFAILLTRMYPPMTTVIPVYLMLKIIGLLDTLTALIIVFAALQIPLVLWVMHAALSRLPRDVVESAVLDGAPFWVVVWKIILPLVTPALVSAGILAFIFSWNDFLLPFVITSSQARPGTVAIMAYTETYRSVLWGSLSTVSIAMIAPTALFMLALRTYLVKGLTAGMLKG
jgi:multiple sugar transport system permease protein